MVIRLIAALIHRVAKVGEAAIVAAFPSAPDDLPIPLIPAEMWDACAEPTSYDEAYREAVQRAADERENIWAPGDFAVWEVEYMRRGENA